MHRLFIRSADAQQPHPALQAAFKSDYVALLAAAGSAMAELLCSKQALSVVRRQSVAAAPVQVCPLLCIGTNAFLHS